MTILNCSRVCMYPVRIKWAARVKKKFAVSVSGGRIIIIATYSSQIAAVIHLGKRGLAKNSDAPIWLSGVSRKNISCPAESMILRHLAIS